MIITLPIRLVRPLICLSFLVFLMFLSGMVLGHTGVLLFTGPRLMERGDLIGIPAALFAGWMLFRLGGQLFRKDSQDADEIRIFSSSGSSAWFVFLLMLLPLAAGLWLNRAAGGFEHEWRFVKAIKPANKSGPAKSAPVPQSNPTTPQDIKEVSARESGLRLSAVFYGTSKPSAVINGEFMFIGDRLREWTVQAIGRGNVTVQNARGRTSTLVIGDR
jgi:hypothetical protein